MLQQKSMQEHFKNHKFTHILWDMYALKDEEKLIKLFHNSPKWPIEVTDKFWQCCAHDVAMEILLESNILKPMQDLFWQYGKVKLHNSAKWLRLDLFTLRKRETLEKMKIFPKNTKLKNKYPSIFEIFYKVDRDWQASEVEK